MRLKTALLALTVLCSLAAPRLARGESQNGEYRGITDPFGDPANYEFAEDEKEDKEFFHLGRFLMLGFDFGLGLFTGGLGATNSSGFSIGAHLLYFFDKSLALEAGGHYSSHLDSVKPLTGGFLDIDNKLVPLTLGFRFYFDTKDAPRAISLANPYLAFGGGMYLRSQTVLTNNVGVSLENPDSTTGNFGAYAGGGLQFLIYRRHIYLGLDVRYHLIFFIDENDTLGGIVQPGERGGDYFTSGMSITYNF